MCWSNYMATPIVLKKPLRVYKVGTVSIFGGFISLFRDFRYRESRTMPTVKINPEFTRRHLFVPGYRPQMWDNFYIYEGYHSYLTKETAKEMVKCSRTKYDDIGIFEIPSGATIYVNYLYEEVVSTNIKYLGLLKE